MRSKQVRTSKLDWPIVVCWGFCLSTTYIAKVRVSVCCDVIRHYTGSFTTSAIHHHSEL